MTTFLGTPVTLEGTALKAGDQMPDFTVTSLELKDIKPMEKKGRKIILSVPSVDTGVCSMELGKFMNFVKGQDEVEVVSVSMDLPFALSRWCQAQDNDVLLTTSDFKDRDFAAKTGTRMAENGLLTRAAFVTDEDGKLVYTEYVDEVSHEPHYDAILEAAGLK
jgi:thiol peroxidase